MAQEVQDNNDKISRRGFLKDVGKFILSIGVISLPFSGTACGPALFLRAGVPRLGGVLWGAVRTRPTLRAAVTQGATKRVAGSSKTIASRLIAKGLIEGGEWYFPPEATSDQIRKLEEEHRRLVLYDDTGAQFETPYGIYEDVGKIQSCYDEEPRFLFKEPSFRSQRICRLDVGEEIGVLDRRFEKITGWYQVQTTREDIGWVHGNCLEELPPAKFYR